MKPILMDTNGWIAINSKRDQLHAAAVTTNQQLLKAGYRYLTTNFVLDETYTGLVMHIGHAAAVDFGERLRRTKTVSIVHISPEIEESAWKLFKQYADKRFSFTDCTSFVVMQQLQLTDAFTSAHHFEQMGFRLLLK